jgi:hypothetical protein
MFAGEATGAPRFALNTSIHDKVPDSVRRTGMPELLHQVLSRRSVNIIRNFEAAGFFEHDAPAMHESSIGTFREKRVLRR